ncbi:PPPDE putative peptidase domain-containing protein [Blastocladiella britannica]|nr:PPPDE putative peptidase domain-containing protein [Blastocladiella britannica]
MSQQQHPVTLLVYDLSQGMARMLSQQLTGRQIEGIWHTSIVVHGREWYFGQGIFATTPGMHHYGRPVQTIAMGATDIGPDMLASLIDDLRPRFRAQDYHLLEHNCNTFSNEMCQVLVGRTIPDWITGLPADFLATPFGQSLRPMIDSFFSSPHAASAYGSGSAYGTASAASPPSIPAPAAARATAPTPSTSVTDVTNQHPHLRRPLPILDARVATPPWAATAPPKMWEKLRSVVVRAAPSRDADAMVAALTAAAKGIELPNKQTDSTVLESMKSLLVEVRSDIDRWVVVDVVRLLFRAELYAVALRDVFLAELDRDLQGTTTPLASSLLTAYLRGISNLVSHTPLATQLLSATTSASTSLSVGPRSLLTSAIVAGLLRDPATTAADLAVVKAATSAALAVARHRYRQARRHPNGTTIWDADGLDEEWAVELVGALAHVVTARTAPEDGPTVAAAYSAVCALMFTAPGPVVDLVGAVGCVPDQLGHVDKLLVAESRTLFSA